VPLTGDNDLPTYVMGLFRYTPCNSNHEESWAKQVASIPADLL
jgi:hypothetical protein